MIKLSATQISKFRSCKRLYAFEYVEGKRPPSTVKQQFGSDVHKNLERWLKGSEVPDKSPAGLTARQGISKPWSPVPGPELMVEHEFELDWVSGATVIGFIDCVVPGDAPMVIDHKTTSSLKWALTPDKLEDDPQALLYATWAALHFGVSSVTARWIYYAASNPRSGRRKPNGILPVEVQFNFGLEETIRKIGSLLDDSKTIVQIREKEIPGLDLDPNPSSCGNYGGCPHKELCGDLSPEDRIRSLWK